LGAVLLEWNPHSVVRGMWPDEERARRVFASTIAHSDWLDFDRGSLHEPQLVERFAARSGETHDDIRLLMTNVRESLTPVALGLELLNHAKAAPLPLFCLSNMPASTYAYLRRRHAFFDDFKEIVISGAVGLLKPEPEIFLHALGVFGIEPEDAIFIDDREDNVSAARAVGIHAYQFRPERECVERLKAVITAPRPANAS